MAVRTRFDKQEAALLLYAYLQVENGRLTRSQAVEYVSKALRRRAELHGIQTDNSFRNTTGISYQYSVMEYVMTDGESGIPHPPILFQKVVRLYRSDPARFCSAIAAALRGRSSTRRPTVSPVTDAKHEVFSTRSNEVDSAENRVYSIDANGFKRWMMSKGLTEHAAVSNSSAIDAVERFARSHGYQGRIFYGNANIHEIKTNAQVLLKDANSTYSNEQYSRLSGALERFILFIEAMGNPSRLGGYGHDRARQATRTIDPGLERRILDTLSKGYPNGIRLDSTIDMKRFAHMYHENFDEEAPSKKVISDVILKNGGIEWSGKTYLIAEEPKQAVRQLLEDSIKAGQRIFYYQELYEANPDYYSDMKVNSAEILEKIIRSTGIKLLYNEHYCVTTGGVSIEDEILRAFADDEQLSADELKGRLPYLPYKKIKSTLSASKLFVLIKRNEYAMVSRINLDPLELKEAPNFVAGEITSQGFASLGTIDITRSLGGNPQLSEMAIRNALYQQVLARTFDRKGQIILPKGGNLSRNEVMRARCLTLDAMTVDEMDEFEAELLGKARNAMLPVAFETMVRVDRDTFVKDSTIDFDVEAIDDALALFVSGGVAPIKVITSFTSFPYVGRPWNLYLLESYVKRFSRRYCIKGGSPARTANVGVICPANDDRDYNDVVAQVLANSSLKLEEHAVGDYLVRLGFVVKKTIFVKKVTEQARVLRDAAG